MADYQCFYCDGKANRIVSLPDGPEDSYQQPVCEKHYQSISRKEN